MNRRGMTLVEMMVAVTATLLLMAAIAQVFAVFGTAVSDSRTVIELDSRMRAVAWRLRSDLNGATAPTLPPVRPDQDAGYFEIVEGPSSDTQLYYDAQQDGALGSPFIKSGTSPGPQATSDDRILGDTDDVLLFTTRNTSTPFLGRYWNGSQAGKYESLVAEVAWFLRPTRSGTTAATSNPTTYTLYRRQLLVVGYVGASPFAGSQNLVDSQMLSGTWATWDSFYRDFDLSVRAARSTSGLITYLPNTLSDLTRRESRFMHNNDGDTTGTSAYKFPTPGYQDAAAPAGLTFEGTSREGDDVVLTGVIGFDVRVFDPSAELRQAAGTLLAPGDPGFFAAGSAFVPPAYGAYVDLGNNTTGRFSGRGDGRSGFAAAGGGTTWVRRARVWDTWSSHYETDGIDQDSLYGTDQASNGLDDNLDGQVDNGDYDQNGDAVITAGEFGELEVPPPYPAPLRGIEVRLRCYEPSSRQVRQITVRHSFVP